MEESPMVPLHSCTNGNNERYTISSKLPPLGIVKVVANHYGYCVEDLTASDRHKSVVTARHAAYWVLRMCGYSYPEMGNIMLKDHTSCISGFKSAEKRRAKDLRFCEETDLLFRLVQ